MLIERKKKCKPTTNKTRKTSCEDCDRMKILPKKISIIVENNRLMVGARNNETIGSRREKLAVGETRRANCAKIWEMSCVEQQ